MKRAGPAVIAALLASILGCYSDAIEPSPPPDPSASALTTAEPTASPGPALVAPVALADELLYYYHTVPFPLSAIAGEGSDELANHPAADALRRSMAKILETFSVPAQGWHYLGESGDVVEFGQWTATDSGQGGAGYSVVLRRKGQTYTPSAWGACRPRLAAPPGKVALEWFLPITPGAAATKVFVDAVEATCAGGPDASLIEPPIVTSADEYVAIALMARFVEGQTGCEKGGCGVVLPTTVELSLPEALGNRSLLDRSVFPARDATVDPFSRGCGG